MKLYTPKDQAVSVLLRLYELHVEENETTRDDYFCEADDSRRTPILWLSLVLNSDESSGLYLRGTTVCIARMDRGVGPEYFILPTNSDNDADWDLSPEFDTLDEALLYALQHGEVS